MSARAARARRPAAMPAPGDPAAERAAIAVWVALVVLAVARALATFAPGMWGWGIGLPRFLAPGPGLALGLLGAAALLPPVARRLVAAFARVGDAIAAGRPATTLAWMAAAALAVALLPDRTWYLGDFLLRRGSIAVPDADTTKLVQAGPLDLWLHYAMPRWVAARTALDGLVVARILGALEAALLAALATAFARALALRGVAAVAAAAVVLCGGYLGMFTGYAKAFSEMVVLAAAVGVFGVRVVRDGRGLLPLGLAVALGLTLHRIALGFVPALVVAWLAFGMAAHRAGRLASALRRPATLAALAIPLGALAWMAPRLVATLTGYDAATHYATAEVRAGGGLVASALGGLRALDLANLALALSPLVVALPALIALRARTLRTPTGAVLAALAVPLAIVLPLIVHPAQGVFRDWDDFAASGVVLSLCVAWLAGEALSAAPRRAWVGASAAVAVATLALAWLAHHADADRGLARATAFVTEPPRRTGPEAGRMWQYVGMFQVEHQRWDAAAAALARAAERTPSPTILRTWALAEAQSGRPAAARDIYHRLLARDPGNTAAWYSLAAVSTQLDDYDEARRALRELLKLDPGNATARGLLVEIDAAHPAR